MLPRLWLLDGSDRPRDRQTMSVIELSWTAKKTDLGPIKRIFRITLQKRRLYIGTAKGVAWPHNIYDTYDMRHNPTQVTQQRPPWSRSRWTTRGSPIPSRWTTQQEGAQCWTLGEGERHQEQLAMLWWIRLIYKSVFESIKGAHFYTKIKRPAIVW